MSYELNIEQFKGPLEKLLELIEEKKLNINEVSLAKVTDDFLAYLSAIEAKVALEKEKEVHGSDEAIFRGLRLVADFIVVASRLLLIKSRSLLPEFSLTDEEEGDIHDLEARLLRYREMKDAEKNIARLWREGAKTWGRPYFLHLAVSSPVFYPGSNISADTLRGAIRDIVSVLEQFTKETDTIKETVISLEEKMKEVVERIKKVVETTLGTISAKRTKEEIIALFLAILHLAREEIILLEQQERFSDIIIRHRA